MVAGGGGDAKDSAKAIAKALLNGARLINTWKNGFRLK
jgi:hypothetical protein